MQDSAAQSAIDSLRATEGLSTAYDSIWAGGKIPLAPVSRFEQVMLSDDKIFVVLTVLLVIWLGIVVYLFLADRRISDLERRLGERINDDDPKL